MCSKRFKPIAKFYPLKFAFITYCAYVFLWPEILTKTIVRGMFSIVTKADLSKHTTWN